MCVSMAELIVIVCEEVMGKTSRERGGIIVTFCPCSGHRRNPPRRATHKHTYTPIQEENELSGQQRERWGELNCVVVASSRGTIVLGIALEPHLPQIRHVCTVWSIINVVVSKFLLNATVNQDSWNGPNIPILGDEGEEVQCRVTSLLITSLHNCSCICEEVGLLFCG